MANSHEHEGIIELFRNAPGLAPHLLRAVFSQEVPRGHLEVSESVLVQMKPVENRADLVLRLRERATGKRKRGRVRLVIVVEVQLDTTARKRYTWPLYQAVLRARESAPTIVLVVTPRPNVARWAKRPIDLGGGLLWAPHVLGPSEIPVLLDPQDIEHRPELAVLSAVAHANRRKDGAELAGNVLESLAKLSRTKAMDDLQAAVYHDLVHATLGVAAKRVLKAMVDSGRYQYQSEFAKKYLAQGIAKGIEKGREEGRLEGEAALLAKQLTKKFGPLSAATKKRLEKASEKDLGRWAERILTAEKLTDVFAKPR